MRLLVMNANTTASMTASIRATATAAAAPGTQILAGTPVGTRVDRGTFRGLPQRRGRPRPARHLQDPLRRPGHGRLRRTRPGGCPGTKYLDFKRGGMIT